MGCGCNGNRINRELEHMRDVARKAALMQGVNMAVVKNGDGSYRVMPADEAVRSLGLGNDVPVHGDVAGNVTDGEPHRGDVSGKGSGMTSGRNDGENVGKAVIVEIRSYL